MLFACLTRNPWPSFIKVSEMSQELHRGWSFLETPAFHPPGRRTLKPTLCAAGMVPRAGSTRKGSGSFFHCAGFQFSLSFQRNLCFWFSTLFVKVSKSLFTTSLQLELPLCKIRYWEWFFIAAVVPSVMTDPGSLCHFFFFFCVIPSQRGPLLHLVCFQVPKDH